MAETPDTEKTPREAVSRKRRFLWTAASIVVLLALGVWAIRFVHKHPSAIAVWFLPLSLAFVALVSVVMLWKVLQWQVDRVKRLDSKERFDRVNEARKTLATILGGIVLLAGFFGTWQSLKVAQENLRVSQEGQITDRFTKAIEQLGAVNADGVKKMVVRLGGIYALERIANESERDHWPIMEVLCTYVRNVAPWPRAYSPGKNPGEHLSLTSRQLSQFSADVMVSMNGRTNFSPLLM